jgi:nitroreductase
MLTESQTYPTDAHSVTRTLTEAATASGYAPSIHNTQPWRWRLTADQMDLYAERSRVLEVTDPDIRFATLSCGAALHHARVSLAAQGWRATVVRMPSRADPDHLAQLHVDGPAHVDPQTVRRMQTIRLRRTDRRPVTGTPVGPDDLAAITTAVEAEGTWLHILRPDQVLDLAAAVDHAQRTEAAEAAWQAELAYWTGGTRPTRSGIPDAAIPQRALQTTVPSRDFGHHGDLPVRAEHDQAATFAILYGRDDEPLDWLRAGEALSAGWLTATELGVSVLPLSATVEVTAARQAMRGKPNRRAPGTPPWQQVRAAHPARRCGRAHSTGSRRDPWRRRPSHIFLHVSNRSGLMDLISRISKQWPIGPLVDGMAGRTMGDEAAGGRVSFRPRTVRWARPIAGTQRGRGQDAPTPAVTVAAHTPLGGFGGNVPGGSDARDLLGHNDLGSWIPRRRRRADSHRGPERRPHRTPYCPDEHMGNVNMRTPRRVRTPALTPFAHPTRR